MSSDVPRDVQNILSRPENQDLFDELNDPDYLNRLHYSRATYALGCHGPLCKMKERHRGRRRTETATRDKGRPYFPNEKVRKVDRDVELMIVYNWHKHDLEGRRLGRKADK